MDLLDFLCSIRDEKKNTLQRATGKFRWSSRRLSSLFPLESTRSLLPIIRRPRPSSSPAVNPERLIDRLIPARDRSDVHVRGELRQSSRQRLSSQFPSCEIYPFRQKPLLPRESLSSVAVSFFSSSPSSSFSSPFTSLSVVVAVVVVVILLFELSRSILSIVAAAGEAR